MSQFYQGFNPSESAVTSVTGSGNVSASPTTGNIIIGLTGITQYDVLVGGPGNTLTDISPSSTGSVLTSNGLAANPTFQPLPFTEIPWNDENTSFSPIVNNGYFITANCTATMPSSASQGNTISFNIDSNSAVLTVKANTGQNIQLGTSISASAGTCVSNNNGDSITFIFRSSDNSWRAINTTGTWTIT